MIRRSQMGKAQSSVLFLLKDVSLDHISCFLPQPHSFLAP